MLSAFNNEPSRILTSAHPLVYCVMRYKSRPISARPQPTFMCFFKLAIAIFMSF